MRRVSSLVMLLVIAVLAYAYRAPLVVFATQLYGQALPCSRPITYSLGSIDPNFHISTDDVRAAAMAATAVWDRAGERALFTYVPSGGMVTVNFVYDDRQQTTQKLKSLGVTISTDRASYDTLNAHYTKLLAEYSMEKRTFDAQNASLERDAAAYELAVRTVNARGGASPEEYAQLQKEKAALEARRELLVLLQTQVNADAADLNAMVQTLNRLAQRVNHGATVYNKTAQTTGEEFEEAVFESAPGKMVINIYEYDSEARLERVLSHEFGHALGLEHVEDPKAIMYRLNQSTNAAPTAADVAELRRVCRL